jgi:predicted O-methyltransferase YrrM
MNELPYVKRLYRETELYKKNSYYPPGHYHSPIVSVDDIRSREASIWKIDDSTNEIPAIELNFTGQKALLKDFEKYYSDLPFFDERIDGLRYYYNNHFYSYTDAITLYCFIRHFKPSKIIEVGSGFSSALMLDVRSLFFNNLIELIFIEPNPERLFSLISNKDKMGTNIIKDELQSVDLTLFKKLKANDILFIDSSHVSKTGSDVNYLLFEILPTLAPGVLIHFHDIFYPFEYLKSWVYSGKNWNENYLLKAFLMYNKCFEIRFFAHFLHTHFKEGFTSMPLCYRNTGGNIWLQKS